MSVNTEGRSSNKGCEVICSKKKEFLHFRIHECKFLCIGLLRFCCLSEVIFERDITDSWFLRKDDFTLSESSFNFFEEEESMRVSDSK